MPLVPVSSVVPSAAVVVPAAPPARPLLPGLTGLPASTEGSRTGSATASATGRLPIRPQTVQYPSSMTPVQSGVALQASPSITTISYRRVRDDTEPGPG